MLSNSVKKTFKCSCKDISTAATVEYITITVNCHRCSFTHGNYQWNHFLQNSLQFITTINISDNGHGLVWKKYPNFLRVSTENNQLMQVNAGNMLKINSKYTSLTSNNVPCHPYS